MNRPDAIACPGCGAAIPRPPIYDEEGGWLAPPAWCDGCGGTARRLETPLTYGPRWYAMVAAAFDKISQMGLVLDPDSVEPLWDQAFPGAEASVMEPMSDSIEAIEIDAAERTAMAIGVLAYGVEFAKFTLAEKAGPAETPKSGNPGITPDDIREAEAYARDNIDDYTEDDVIRIAERNFQDNEKKRLMTTDFFDRIRAGDVNAVDEAIYLIQVHALPDDHPMWIDG